jgi:hypothetical protein
MKNKLFMMAMLAIALVFGMTVVGCDNVQTVAFERADAVGGVSAFVGDYYDDEGNLFASITVSWSETNNALSYNIYVQNQPSEEGPIKGLYVTRQLASDVSGNEWNMSGPFSDFTNNLRFGVTANDFDENHVASKIVWSEYIAVPSVLIHIFVK